MKIEYAIPAIVVTAFIMFIIGASVGSQKTGYYMIKESIERGYGLYCPKDGLFAWKGECK